MKTGEENRPQSQLKTERAAGECRLVHRRLRLCISEALSCQTCCGSVGFSPTPGTSGSASQGMGQRSHVCCPGGNGGHTSTPSSTSRAAPSPGEGAEEGTRRSSSRLVRFSPNSAQGCAVRMPVRSASGESPPPEAFDAQSTPSSHPLVVSDFVLSGFGKISDFGTDCLERCQAIYASKWMQI